MSSLKPSITQQRNTFAAKIAVRLRRHNPELILEIDCRQLMLKWFDALKKDCKTMSNPGEVRIEFTFRNARGNAVLFPNGRNGQFQHLIDSRAADDGAYWAR
jgi:hypothetical protein